MTKEERAKFREGGPVEVSSITDAYAFLEEARQFFPNLKWGGKERIGFKAFNIHKDNYPIYFWKEDDALWWVPKSDIEEKE